MIRLLGWQTLPPWHTSNNSQVKQLTNRRLILCTLGFLWAIWAVSGYANWHLNIHLPILESSHWGQEFEASNVRHTKTGSTSSGCQRRAETHLSVSPLRLLPCHRTTSAGVRRRCRVVCVGGVCVCVWSQHGELWRFLNGFRATSGSQPYSSSSSSFSQWRDSGKPPKLSYKHSTSKNLHL